MADIIILSYNSPKINYLKLQKFLTVEKIESCQNAVICRDIQKMSVRKKTADNKNLCSYKLSPLPPQESQAHCWLVYKTFFDEIIYCSQNNYFLYIKRNNKLFNLRFFYVTCHIDWHIKNTFFR